MRTLGADLIVLRACDACGHWPYTHYPGCPIQAEIDREYRAWADSLAALAVAGRPPTDREPT